MRRSLLVLFLSTLVCSQLFAASSVTSALINKALDQQQKLDLDTTLPQAMTQIGNLTGVRIEADPLVWDLLPWGEQTNITAKIENRTLREALIAITQKLGLEFALTDETVELRPMPALRRLSRRSTVQELAALDLLTSTPMSLSSERPTVRELLSSVDAKLDSAKTPYAIENRAPDATQDVHVAIPRNATMAETLEDMVHQTNATWYPWGRTIVIVAKQEQVRNQLAKSLTARYRNVDVGQVLLELFQRAGVDFTVDPGSFERIPPGYRNITLLLDNATIQQALETIGGYTGLGFEATDNGVHVWNQLIPSPTTTPASSPSTSSRPQ
jgi:hypothetical protein